MNQPEENLKNFTEMLNLANKLPEDKQVIIAKTLELLNNATECVDKGQIDEAISKYYMPLISMLTFEFIRQFIAEHLPEKDIMDLLVGGIFK